MPRPAYAGLVSRVAALVVDIGVLTVAGLAVTTLPALAWEQLIGEPPGWFTAGSAALASALPWIYFTSCWWLTGRTGGNLVFGTQVRTRSGRPLPLPRAALRALVGLALAPVWLVGLVGVLTDERRRAWHDRLFGTAVYYQTVVETHHGAL